MSCYNSSQKTDYINACNLINRDQLEFIEYPVALSIISKTYEAKLGL